MSTIPGAIPVTGFIGPTDSNDTYAVTDAIFGIDGYRSVSAITARNTITLERRREGMLVYTQDDKNIWQLLQGPWTFTNSDWKLFISSAATSSLSGNSGFLSLSGGTITGDTLVTQSFTATTFYSGSTPLQTILNMFSGGTGSGGGFSGWTGSSGISSIIANNGSGNLASGNYSLVVGKQNSATTLYSSILGGKQNLASGNYSFIGNGSRNLANGNYTSIISGLFNSATTNFSTIVGGKYNIVSGNTYSNGSASFIGGGSNNIAIDGAYGSSSVVVGGQNNFAGGDYYSASFIGGGKGNIASGNFSTVVGGHYNKTYSNNSFIGGGYNNKVKYVNSIVVGGVANINSGNTSVIGGGNNNFIGLGSTVTISGGLSNKASNYGSSIGGGHYNIAYGYHSTIAGGGNNYAIGANTFIGGGYRNSATTGFDLVVGGFHNLASGGHSSVLGGYSNIARGAQSSVLNGLNNTASGKASSVLAGTGHTVSGRNSAIIGGGSINGTADDTVYMPNAIIQSGVTASTINLNTTTLAPINVPIFFVDPSPLSNGDLWATSGITGVFLNLRVNGVTKSVELS